MEKTSAARLYKLELIERVKKILANKDFDFSDVSSLPIFAELQALDQFGYAAELMLKKIESLGTSSASFIKDHQDLAKFLYKDTTLPSVFKFNESLNALYQGDPLASSTKCETLGLAGAAYKRKWLFDHQFKNLIFSRFYYKKGYEIWKKFIEEKGDILLLAENNDQGFTAINYAYINELMSVDKLEEHGEVTGISQSIIDRLMEADSVRRLVLGLLTEKAGDKIIMKNGLTSKWILPTVIEAYFGTRQYNLAIPLIGQLIEIIKTDRAKLMGGAGQDEINKRVAWEIRTFQVQLFSIAYLQLYQKRFIGEHTTESFPFFKLVTDQVDSTKINECLSVFSMIEGAETDPGEKALLVKKPLEIKKDGRLGLALSGGGFRASLFHIGVLAALAEKDILRNVEVISCVSGGSIIGAHYYLLLKKKLEEKNDAEISCTDYVDIVETIEKDFLKGVQKNLRMRVFTHFGSNLKMVFKKNYSRTHRMGELYEKYLFAPAMAVKNPIYMDSLFINPEGYAHNFNIDTENWNRENKVPRLILNATSMNTGHNWQFTASWMGEPPANIQPDIDVKPRLRRMYYDQAPAEYRKFRLGYAVGASSCVPVMFTPIPFPGLYKDVDLQLIDGGLHDNQGIAALIDQECQNMIISDASGQLPLNSEASRSSSTIFYRADNILQERVRELQFKDVKERNYTSQLNKLLSIHLKNGLRKMPENWVGCDEPVRQLYAAGVAKDEEVPGEFGILFSIQRLLSEIRTDLDSFHDTEAYALMYSGYRQVLLESEKQKMDGPCNKKGNWNFLSIEKYMSGKDESMAIRQPLKIARIRAFKVYYLSKTFKIITILAGIASLGAIVFVSAEHWKDLVRFRASIVILITLITSLFLLSGLIGPLAKIKARLNQALVHLPVVVFMWVVCNVYIVFINKIYNKEGELPKV